MTATRVRTARITPSKVKKLRNLWARRASSASLKVSESATRLLRNPLLAAGRSCGRADAADPPALFTPSNVLTPKPGLRGTADTMQYGYKGPFVSPKCEGYKRIRRGGMNFLCFHGRKEFRQV